MNWILQVPEEEHKIIKEQTEMYHKYNDLVREGIITKSLPSLKMVIMTVIWKSQRINLKHL